MGDSPQTHVDTIKKLIAAKVADGKRRMKVLTDDHSKRRREAATKHEAKAAMELAESKQEAKEEKEMKNETQTFEAKKQKAQVAADEAAEAEEEVKKAEEGGFDPTAAGAQETILNLKDKIAVMKKKKAYAEQVSVVNSMNEMKFKVEAKTPEAVKAKATVDDVEEGVPSVNGAVEERLRKSRDKYKMKELEEKAKVPDDPEPEGWDTLNKKPKKKDPVDLLAKTGAAIGVELREAVNDAK